MRCWQPDIEQDRNAYQAQDPTDRIPGYWHSAHYPTGREAAQALCDWFNEYNVREFSAAERSLMDQRASGMCELSVLGYDCCDGSVPRTYHRIEPGVHSVDSAATLCATGCAYAEANHDNANELLRLLRSE